MKDLSLTQLIADIKSGKKTKQEVSQYFMKRIEKHDHKIQAYNFINEKEESSALLESPLAGVPIAIKDIFCEK
jgi:Asp-tRNA(Asn)/Glu-tRNA(Gln) amidotransferase A subunit family amidase